MALISKSIPNLINGVSQQPPALRLPTQGATQENGLSDVVDGLKKRPPTKFLNKLVKVSSSWTAGSALTSSNTEAFTSLADCYITTYKRSQTEQYTVVIEPHSTTPVIYVYDINGNLNYQSNKASWKGDGTWCVDNTDSTAYLADITKEEMTSTSVADATFIVNKSKVVAKGSAPFPVNEGHAALVYLKSVNYEREYSLTFKQREIGETSIVAVPEADLTVTCASLGANADNTDHQHLAVSNIIGEKVGTADAQNPLRSQVSGIGSGSEATSSQTFNATANRSTDSANAAYGVIKTITLDSNTFDSDHTKLTVYVGGYSVPYNTTTFSTTIDGDVLNSHLGWIYGSASNTIILPYNVFSWRYYGNMDVEGIRFSRGEVSVFKYTSASDRIIEVTPTVYKKEPYFIVTASEEGSFGDFDLVATDDDGGQNLKVFKDSAKSFTSLPNQCINGFRLQVEGDNNKKEDNFHVMFEGAAGAGYWKESVAPNVVNDFDTTTLPHTLKQMVDSSGNLYFTFTQGQDNDGQAWRSRKAGDDDTNPFPSFVGNNINDIFFHRNRLGIISGENVIFSETSNFFNFFRTTVRALLDSDPIDVAVSQNEVSELKAALPIQDSLLLFSELNQFTLSSSQLLTPAEVTIDQSTKFECDLRTSPIGAGNSVFFNTVGGNFAGVREYFTDGETEIKDATLITSHVPEYLSGNVRKMAASTNEDMLICLTSAVKSEAYIYKWYNSNNERLQSSWSKWKFDKNVADVTFNNSDLYITFEDGSFEKMSLRTDAPDVTFASDDTIEVKTGHQTYRAGGSFFNIVNIGSFLGTLSINPTSQTILFRTPRTHKSLTINGTAYQTSAASLTVDEYTWNNYFWDSTDIASNFFSGLVGKKPSIFTVVEGSVTFGGKKHELLLDHRRKIVATNSINTTTALLALAPDANSTTQWIDHKGEILATGTSVQAVVNYLYGAGAFKTHIENGVATANHVTVGQPYTFKYQMSEQTFEAEQGDPTQLARFQLRSMSFNFNDTGTFVVTTASTGRAASVATYTGRITGQAQNLLSYSAVVDSDSFKVGIQSQAKETEITITSDSHLPCVFQSAEYEGWVTLRNQRL